MHIDKHFTATTYLLDRKTKRTLLHWHNKIQTWLPPGGHIEKNESPEEAARREIQEEYGIKELEFIITGSNPKRIDERCEMLLMPHFLLSEEIEPRHYHLDWVFFAWVNVNELNKKTIASNTRWFTLEDLENEENCFKNVKEMAKIGFRSLYDNI